MLREGGRGGARDQSSGWLVDKVVAAGRGHQATPNGRHSISITRRFFDFFMP